VAKRADFALLVNLKKFHYVVVTVNVLVVVYILAATKYSCLSTSWYVYVVLIHLWLVVISFIVEIARLIRDGCPTE
jgi:hypothetical protein